MATTRFLEQLDRIRTGRNLLECDDSDEGEQPTVSRRRRAPDPNTSNVKRALFGTPDHDENIRFVKRELAKNCQEASERWNFDFANEKPREGRFEWQVLEANVGKSNSRTIVSEDCDKTTDKANSNENHHPKEIKNLDEKNDKKDSQPKDDANKSVASNKVKLPDSKATTKTLSSSTSSVKAIKSSLDSAAAKVSPSVSLTSNSRNSSITSQRRQTKIPEHYTCRKRSKSKVKTQESKNTKDGKIESSLTDNHRTSIPIGVEVSQNTRQSSSQNTPESYQ